VVNGLDTPKSLTENSECHIWLLLNLHSGSIPKFLIEGLTGKVGSRIRMSCWPSGLECDRVIAG
jgi:hypothetical protein